VATLKKQWVYCKDSSALQQVWRVWRSGLSQAWIYFATITISVVGASNRPASGCTSPSDFSNQ
jgi:hypothetical protein